MSKKDIDLHGKFYDDIELALEDHFYNNIPPFKIINTCQEIFIIKVIYRCYD